MSGVVARQRRRCSWRASSISGSVLQGCSFLLLSSVCMGFFLRLRSHRYQDQLAVLRVDLDRIAIANGAIENATGDAVLDFLLNDALEGACSKLRVEAHHCQQIPCGTGELQRDVPLGQARAQTIDLDVHNIPQLLTRELMEDDDRIDAVDELWTEALFPQALTNQALDLVLRHAVELVQPACAYIAGHDDDGIFEIDGAPLPIGQPTVIKQLQQDVKSFRRRFFDFVEEHDAVGPPPDGLGQLPPLFVADVAGRSPDQARDAVPLHVLGHVDPNECPLIVEQEFSQGACQLRLPHTGWPQEHEAGQGAIGVLQSSARTTNGIGDRLHGLVLPNDALAQPILHRQQLLHLPLHELRDRDMGPLANDLRNILGIDFFLEHARTPSARQLRLHLMNTLLQLRNGSVAQARHFLIVIRAFGLLQRYLGLLQLLLQAANLLDGFAFALQRQLHGAQLLGEVRKLLLDFGTSFAAGGICLLFQRLQFHLQLADAAIERIDLARCAV